MRTPFQTLLGYLLAVTTLVVAMDRASFTLTCSENAGPKSRLLRQYASPIHGEPCGDSLAWESPVDDERELEGDSNDGYELGGFGLDATQDILGRPGGPTSVAGQVGRAPWRAHRFLELLHLRC